MAHKRKILKVSHTGKKKRVEEMVYIQKGKKTDRIVAVFPDEVRVHTPRTEKIIKW